MNNCTLFLLNIMMAFLSGQKHVADNTEKEWIEHMPPDVPLSRVQKSCLLPLLTQVGGSRWHNRGSCKIQEDTKRLV